jgi:hypothetical protein
MQGPKFHSRASSELELLNDLIAHPALDQASFEQQKRGNADDSQEEREV